MQLHSKHDNTTRTKAVQSHWPENDDLNTPSHGGKKKRKKQQPKLVTAFTRSESVQEQWEQE
jgi:hypothetical protein